jgi:capsular exopolysaccharide synthesis family protein
LTASEAPADKAALPSEIRALSLGLPAHSPLLPFGDGQWCPSEQYRILRTKISQHPKQPHLIVVSSPTPGDGKSVSAINTAGALSLKSEGQVLLVDADFRKSAVHVQLGIPESPGLAEVLNGSCTLEEAVVSIREFPNLLVMSAGARPDNPAELLDSPTWRGLCIRLRSLFRYVVLDSPPVGAVADYDLIQAVCDGVILVLRPDHTNRQLCLKSLENIPKAKLLGVLLNCVPDWSPARRSGADYYYYASGKAYSSKHRDAAG